MFIFESNNVQAYLFCNCIICFRCSSIACYVIIKFDELNFSYWCEQIRFRLGVLDLDLTLLSEEPVALTFANSDEDKSFYKAWERSNRLTLMFMLMIVIK